ncbi:hypothetical protein BHM03_00060866 [Ensete ventricosum]|nr:hypothetical protein BHM03_00060866 [Ensete ventricosum]
MAWPPTRGQLAEAKAPCTGGDRLRARSLAMRCPQGRPAVGRRPQGATANSQPARGDDQLPARKGLIARGQLAEGRRPSPA